MWALCVCVCVGVCVCACVCGCVCTCVNAHASENVGLQRARRKVRGKVHVWRQAHCTGDAQHEIRGATFAAGEAEVIGDVAGERKQRLAKRERRRPCRHRPRLD